MAQGDKGKYTAKQVRKAEHIATSYEATGLPEAEAEARAWATVNKEDGGGKMPGGSGRRRSTGSAPAGNPRGASDNTSSNRTAEERSASAKKAAATRKRNAGAPGKP